MQAANFDKTVEAIVHRDPRYHRDAYHFVREALDHTHRTMESAPQPATPANPEGIRHVSGQELLAGIRGFALQQFGPMALLVFQEWGVSRCEDFGEIVFSLVESGLFAKTEKDSREDFKGGYDFVEAFRQPFLPSARTALKLLPEPRASQN